MIMKTKIVLMTIIILSIFCNKELLGKNRKTIDLAGFESGSIKIFNGNCKYDSIVFSNIVGRFKYSIEIENEKTMLEPLNLNIIDNEARTLTVQKNSPRSSKLKILIDTLIQYQQGSIKTRNEKDLAKLVYNIRTNLKTEKNTPLEIELAERWINATQMSNGEMLQVSNGEKATITITRDTLKWTFIFKGDEVGKWITSYGFGFTTSVLNGSTYYTKQLGDSSAYKILKSSRHQITDLSYIPAIFFSFFPSQNLNKKINFSWTGGLGFDLSAPVVFAGINLMYYNNIGLSLGIAFQQQYSLKNQYSENDIVTMPLNISQLHDKIYKPNIFIAINFRFNE